MVVHVLDHRERFKRAYYQRRSIAAPDPNNEDLLGTDSGVTRGGQTAPRVPYILECTGT